MRSRSLLRQRLAKAAAPRPRTDALPRWDTSNTPTAVRTAVCSFAECVPDALCGPRAKPPAIGTDLPCDFALEEEKSVQSTVFLVQEKG